MEKRVNVFDDNMLKIERICDEFEKEYEIMADNVINIKGDNLDGLLDRIKMNLLGEVIFN